MALRVRCRQDVVESDVDEVIWIYSEKREPPVPSVEVVCYADGSSPCSRCGLRHPVEQQLHREGVRPRGTMPLGWGTRAAEQARDERPVEDFDWTQVRW